MAGRRGGAREKASLTWPARRGSQEQSTGECARRFGKKLCAAVNFEDQRGYRNRNSGVRSCRSCRIREQGLYPKIHDQHLPRKIGHSAMSTVKNLSVRPNLPYLQGKE